MFSLGATIAIVVLGAIIVLPLFLLGGWIVMLCLGALAHIFGIWNLAIGFWPSLLVGIILSILF